jgi:hypothetical protein
LTENCGTFENARLNMQGLYSESKTMTPNISSSSVEHSLPPLTMRSADEAMFSLLEGHPNF